MLKYIKSNSFFLTTFIFLFVVGMCSHLLTLSFSPLPWIDEVEIAEMVRDGVVHSPSDYSLHFYCKNEVMNSQSWALFYVGGWIQNLFHSAFGSYGPRIASLLGLMFATLFSALFSWKKTESLKFASVIGVIVFSFPIFVQSARGARVDIWTIGLLFLALYLLESYAKRSGKSRIIVSFAVGSIACFSVFTWITSILLGPVYLWALLAYSKSDGKWRKSIFVAMIGGLLTAGILLMPFVGTKDALSNFIYVLTSVSGASNKHASAVNEIIGFAKSLIGYPFVFFFGIVFLCLSKRTLLLKLGALMFFLIVVVICAHVYVYRLVYFAPYCILGLCVYFAECTRGRKLVFALCSVLALFCYARGVVVRNGIEYLTKTGRDQSVVKAALEKIIGQSESVYCDTHQLYYVGCELNWRQFKFVEGFDAEEIARRNITWYIGEEKTVTEKHVVDLQAAGYILHGVVGFDVPKIHPIFDKIVSRAGRTRCYGPYVLYRRAVVQ